MGSGRPQTIDDGKMVTLQKEIVAVSKDYTGCLAKATSAIHAVGVNINAFCCYAREGIAFLHFLTDHNARAMESLNRSGFETTENEVIMTILSHRVGSLDDLAHRLSEAGIDIRNSYASVAGSDCLAIFATNNNRKALEILK
jgi:hypothetical protein